MFAIAIATGIAIAIGIAISTTTTTTTTTITRQSHQTPASFLERLNLRIRHVLEEHAQRRSMRRTLHFKRNLKVHDRGYDGFVFF
tara:strand:+ start:370 stop:624 length:255 start_codon:yes stop_codon:yes gene_type:complete